MSSRCARSSDIGLEKARAAEPSLAVYVIDGVEDECRNKLEEEENDGVRGELDVGKDSGEDPK